MQNGNSNENVIKKKTSSKEINILEWKYKQFLGEKLQYSNMQNQQENESFLLTKIRFTPDGSEEESSCSKQVKINLWNITMNSRLKKKISISIKV